MKVLKFGGTSLGTPERFGRLPDLFTGQEKRIVVLSAISGTTDQLVRINDCLEHGDKHCAGSIVNELEKFYSKFIYDLFDRSSYYYNQSRLFVEERIIKLQSLIEKPFTRDVENEILAQGEILSTGLFRCLLKLREDDFIYLHAPDFLFKNREGQPDIERLGRKLENIMTHNPDIRLFITQGFICSNHEGKLDTLGRGGSDFTASLIGAALGVDEIQIWTDVDGVHNNDPRLVEDTQPIPELSYEEADELAYFGAKVLHPACVFPAKQRNIPIRIKNTMNPDAPGTMVHEGHKGSSIKAVALKDGITAVRIRSARMLMAYGFLRKVFEIFERYKTPIDMISTSEVSVSLTIDDKTNLEKIVTELMELGTVEVDENQTIVCVVGDFMAEKPGMIRIVLNALREIPVRMISYGGSMNNVSLLLHEQDKVKALHALHHHLFLNREIHVN